MAKNFSNLSAIVNSRLRFAPPDKMGSIDVETVVDFFGASLLKFWLNLSPSLPFSASNIADLCYQSGFFKKQSSKIYLFFKISILGSSNLVG